jgi:hypothetical protein
MSTAVENTGAVIESPKSIRHVANGSSPIRRRRRTKAEMTAIRDAIISTLANEHPMTVRQVFYRLASEAVIAKTEADYKNAVCRLLAEMRRSGEIPYDWLADATRWMRKPTTFSSAEEALRRTASTYRRALWDYSDVAVEIWLEKEALAGVLVEITDEWDVPLMVTRGYPSMSFLHSAAEAIASRDQLTCIYYFGDRDPSGVDIDRAVREGIGESLAALGAGDEEQFGGITFTRVAVTEEQMAKWDLPTRPTKRSDTRSKNFRGESVELDAIPPDRLRQLASDSIEAHVNHRQLDVLRVAERGEREVLETMAAALNGSR